MPNPVTLVPILRVIKQVIIIFQLVNDTNEYEVFASDLRGNPIYVTYYIFWSKFLLVEVIPYFLIVILNSLIITKIWKSNKFRRRFVVRFVLTYFIDLYSTNLCSNSLLLNGVIQ